MINHIQWENNKLCLLDQRKLPKKIIYYKCKNYKMVLSSIKDMIVRGAPAIGVTTAYGIAQAMLEKYNKKLGRKNDIKKYFEKISKEFFKTRPTAVNLYWAICEMRACLNKNIDKPNLLDKLVKEAIKIHKDDILINRKIGDNGSKLIRKKINILTHCNAGALATAGYGTALGVIRSAYKNKKINMVYVDETRPYLQGARLTAFELINDNIPATLICDNMAGYFMSKGLIDAVVIGADRIAANGDAANKIGSYSLSVLAAYHKIPFWVAAPLSTVDLNTPTGEKIEIEERHRKEVTHVGDHQLAPNKICVCNPSFDVVPAKFISAIITEKGVIKGNFKTNLKKLFKF